ncbi:transposase family protein [Streptomyces sp. NPDC001275]
MARTRTGPVACPRCGHPTVRVHGYHRRRLADLPVGRQGGAWAREPGTP